MIEPAEDPVESYPPEERRHVHLARGLVGPHWAAYQESPEFHAAVRAAVDALIPFFDHLEGACRTLALSRAEELAASTGMRRWPLPPIDRATPSEEPDAGVG